MKTPKEWADEYRRDLNLSIEKVIREAMADAWREATQRERERIQKDLTLPAPRGIVDIRST